MDSFEIALSLVVLVLGLAMWAIVGRIRDRRGRDARSVLDTAASSNTSSEGRELIVLLREISPYTSAPLYLGLFSSSVKAEAARQAYLNAVANDDPWRVQAYRTAQLPDDVVTLPVPDHRISPTEAEVLLVVAVFDGMGQITHRYEGVYSLSDREAAERYVEAREAESWETAPNWCEINEIIIDHREPPPPAPEWLIKARD